MSKVLTLRGIIKVADNAQSVDNQIFSYEANDLTKGWVVEGAFMWPTTTRAGTGSANGQFQLTASIATDTITPIDPTDLTFDDFCDADDNRQIGWLGAGYQRRDSAVGDFLANSGNSPNPAEFIIDPGHILAQGLYLNMYTTSDSTTSPVRDWSYLVILRPKKLDPKETILHLIKNVAQDIAN